MNGWMWLATVIGVVVLGFMIFYGQRSSDQLRRRPSAIAEREAAAHRLYQEEDAERARKEENR